jgi:hypothetical protein
MDENRCIETWMKTRDIVRWMKNRCIETWMKTRDIVRWMKIDVLRHG